MTPQPHLPQCLAGDSQPLDVCSVHQASTVARYSVSLLGYGFYGDVLAESEKHRWMGPLRYDYSGVSHLEDRDECMLNYCKWGTVRFSVFIFILKLNIHPETDQDQMISCDTSSLLKLFFCLFGFFGSKTTFSCVYI